MELKTQMTVSEAQEFFGILGAVVDECRANLYENKLTVRARDPANVAIVTADLITNVLKHQNKQQDEVPLAQAGIDVTAIQGILEEHKDTAYEGVKLKFIAGNPPDKLEISIGCIVEELTLLGRRNALA